MENITCQNCSHELPARAMYCSKCKKQVKCKSCNELLEKDAIACIICGTSTEITVSDNQNVTHDNVFEYEESHEHRKIKASFSNEVGNTFSAAIGSVISGKQIFIKGSVIGAKNNQETKRELPSFDYNITEDTDATDVTNHPVLSLFKSNGEQLVLDETRLKATGKLDYAKRATYMFLYYNHNNGLSTVSKSDVISFIECQGVNDGHFRTWLSNNISEFDLSGDKVGLLAAGRDTAMKILKEVKDNNVPNPWDPTSAKSKTKEKAAELEDSAPKENKKKGDSSRSRRANAECKVVDIDFYPKTGEPSLVDFYKQYKDNSNYHRNALFIYYLKQIRNFNKVSVDEIYTCYRALVTEKVKTPAGIYQSLIEMKKEGLVKGELTDVELASNGLNLVEHKLKIT